MPQLHCSPAAIVKTRELERDQCEAVHVVSNGLGRLASGCIGAIVAVLAAAGQWATQVIAS